jgi:arginyl-tRNA synthetase
MNIKNEIEALLKEALEKLEIEFDGDFNLDHQQDLKFGDWTTNVALQLAGKVWKNPREFAEQIRAQIPENENIEKIEIAGPGYLNFYLSLTYFAMKLKGKNKMESKNKTILLEHSSPNLFKPFHIGHMVNNSIGESLGRILKYAGYDLKQISFPSDAGPGIAKTV